MKNILKKTLALTLVMCSLLGLWLPAATKVSAAEYPFEEFGEVTGLGEVLKGDPNISGLVEIAEKGGRQYLGVPIKGGQFCVFALTDFLEKKPNADGNYLYAMVESDIGVPRGIAVDSKGNFYVSGDSSSVFFYNLNTGASGKISTGASSIYSVAVDEKDNVYATGKKSGAAVYKLNVSTKSAQQIYQSADFISGNSVAAGDGKVYFQGGLPDSAGGGSQICMLSSSGELLSKYDLPATGGSYYLAYVDGVVFLGVHSGTTTDGLIALDTAGSKLKRMDLGNQNTIMGMVSNPTGGKAYLCLANDGTYEYDVATRTLGRKVSNTCNRPLRSRNFVRNGSDLLLLSTGPSSVTTIKGPSGNTVGLADLLEGAYSYWSPRSMTPGVPGMGVAVYVGAYLSPSVGSYTPGAESPLEYPVFSNGHAQTDSMLAYNGKIYAGAYSGAYLVQYDPTNAEVRELIPGLSAEYGQLRIHGLAAGDNKIFFSTIPGDQKLGGCIGWYDLLTDEWYCVRNVIQDQAAVTLTYDEQTGILYGGTTIRGGTNTTPTASQAVLFAYDVAGKRLLATTTLSSLTGDRPKNIYGVAQDPNTGKLWGLVSQTVFSFTYEDGELHVTKEWAAGTVGDDPYPDGGSLSWFPKAILFDENGNMYMGLNQEAYGLMKFTLGADGKIQKATTIAKVSTRIYTLGADGNLYYYGDQLYKISLGNRVAEVRTLIDCAADDAGIAKARQAYDSLTEKEKEQLGDNYYQMLLRLESGDEQILNDTITAINAIGQVTAASGEDVEKAIALYNSLTAVEKRKVYNAHMLFDAQETYIFLSTPDENAPEDPVETVMAFIGEIGEVTADSGPAIQKARVAYDNLTASQKKLVHNAQSLFDAEQAYVDLLTGSSSSDKQDSTDVDLTEAILVKTQIDAIGTVTANSGSIIQSARQAYDALTEEQKAQVPNAQLLFDAEKAYAALTADADSDQGGNGVWILILVAVLVLAAGAAVTVVLLRKKKVTVEDGAPDAPLPPEEN